MHATMSALAGKVLTVTGPADPSELGRVMMHEHLHSDLYDGASDQMVWEERPTTPERRRYLLEDAVPLLRDCRERHGMAAYCDVTMPPWRAWPDVYEEVSRTSGVRIVLCTGFYREIETGTYMVRSPDRSIWPYVRAAPMEELAEMCCREIVDGIHGTKVRAGCIKLGTSQGPMTPTEHKCFRAAARAQTETGVHITTHCTQLGAETSQLMALDLEGVDLRRVVVGHTAAHIMSKTSRRTVLAWMSRGASFMPTNLAIGTSPADWQPLVDGIHELFDAGHGDKLHLGMDSGYCSERGKFERMWFLPPPPWLYFFTDVLPAFRALGLTGAEEDSMLVANPARMMPIGG